MEIVVMSMVMSVPIPVTSALYAALAKASFHDAYSAPLSDASLTPIEIALRTLGATPRWVSASMSIRNAIARRLGLKDVGGMRAPADKPSTAYNIGDALGIFTILGISDDELLLGIDDSHLDVRVALTKPEGDRSHRYVVSTVVIVHNLLGRAYMVPVGRIHPFVARAILRRTPI
jgi:hypothetical protein